MFAVLRPVVPVPPAHRWATPDARRRLVVKDLLAGLRGGHLRLA